MRWNLVSRKQWRSRIRLALILPSKTNRVNKKVIKTQRCHIGGNGNNKYYRDYVMCGNNHPRECCLLYNGGGNRGDCNKRKLFTKNGAKQCTKKMYAKQNQSVSKGESNSDEKYTES